MPTSCQTYYSNLENATAAASWCRAGGYFSWSSTLEGNQGLAPLNLFYACLGDPTKPALLLIHGYPTSSYDFAALAQQLGDEYYVCVLDTPGYGFSDKPRGRYAYSILDDARLVDHFIRNVAHLSHFTLLTHDKGNSVGLALLQIYQAYADKPYTIDHHFLTNGNVYLPLAQLTVAQRLLLHPITGPLLSSLVTGSRMANGLARKTCTPALDPEQADALATVLDYQEGMKIQHKLIQYLNERKVNEVSWLEALDRSDVPTTLIWGELDQIAPVAVADYVWEHTLKDRAAPASYWRIPCANHYLQLDQPELLADLVRSTLTGNPVSFDKAQDCQPIQIGRGMASKGNQSDV